MFEGAKPLGIERILESPVMMTAFSKYLDERLVGHYLEAWLLIDEYKTASLAEREDKGKHILSHYFKPNVQTHVNLDEEICSRLESQVQKKTQDCFDGVQRLIWSQLSQQAPDFFRSGHYKEALKKKPRSKKRTKKLKKSKGQQGMMILKYFERKEQQEREKPEKEESNVTKPNEEKPISSLAASIPSAVSMSGIPSSSDSKSANTLFTKLILHKDFLLAKALIDTAVAKQEESICLHLVDLFLYHNSFSDFIACLFAAELENYNEFTCSAMFREDSPATFIMFYFLQRLAGDFLRSLVDPTIRLVYERHPEGVNIEANRVSKGETIGERVEVFRSVVEIMLGHIFTSVERCPVMLRKELGVIHNLVESKFPGFGIDVLSSLIFLRFICPSIIIPELHHSMEKPSRPVRRTLVALSKLLQNLINGNDRCTVDALVKIANDTNREALSKYFQSLMKVNLPEQVPTTPLSEEVVSNNASEANKAIKVFLLDNLEPIWARVITSPDLTKQFFPFILRGLKSLNQLSTGTRKNKADSIHT